jgi:hypothetical protein
VAILQSKGTSFLMEISSVYTAMPQIISLSISGEAAEVFDATTLDGGAPKVQANTGYVTNATISGECFFDPDNAVHSAFRTKVRAAGTNNFKITYTDATPTSEIYSGLGLGMDYTIAAADGVKASFTVQTTGAVT